MHRLPLIFLASLLTVGTAQATTIFYAGAGEIRRATYDGSTLSNHGTFVGSPSGDYRGLWATNQHLFFGPDTAGPWVSRVDLDGSNLTVLNASTNTTAQGIGSDPNTGQVFFTDTNLADGIYRMEADGTAFTPLFTFSVGTNTRGLALDPGNQHVYYVRQGSLSRLNYDGTGSAGIVATGVEVRELSLDLVNGHAYWTDFFGGVNRVNLDGTGATNVVAGGAVGLALDVPNNRLYYGNGSGLFVSDLNGNNAVQLVSGVNVTSIAITNAVPEPSTHALLALLLAAVALTLRARPSAT